MYPFVLIASSQLTVSYCQCKYQSHPIEKKHDIAGDYERCYYCLPGDTVDFSSFSAFKRSIERVDLSDFLNFT